MTDTSTGERLLVSTARDAGPYLDLPWSQVEAVRKRLDRAGIPYWVDQWLISIDGGPEFTSINFSRYVDADRIQAGPGRAPECEVPAVSLGIDIKALSDRVDAELLAGRMIIITIEV